MKDIKFNDYTGDIDELIAATANPEGTDVEKFAYEIDKYYNEFDGGEVFVNNVAVGNARIPYMALEYAIPAAETTIALAIKAAAGWFNAGQSVVIDWGDGSANDTVSATSGHTGYIGHTYASAGTYKVRISGSLTRYGRDSAVDLAGQALLTRVDSFGKLGVTSFTRAFYKCTGLMSVPKTLPDGVTNMQAMLYYCSGAAFNPNVSSWDVSKVGNMQAMFQYCSGAAFNPNVSSWDVSKVGNMSSMFTGCSGAAFNPNVTKWDVSKVENMYAMFSGCSGAAFNPDVSAWDVSKVTNMGYMFEICSNPSFRGGRGADGLGVGIAKWIPKSLLTGTTTGLSKFMLGARVQDATYLDSILNAWAALIGDPENPLPTGITCHFGATKYTAAGAASYAQLTAPTSSGGAAWTISSGGLQ